MKMIRNSLVAIGVIIAPFAMQTTANAAPLSAGFSYNYTDDVLTDSNAGGLSWLSLNKTRGDTYNDVVAEMNAGGDLEDYRYATGAEVNHLISNWIGSTLSDDYNKHAEETSPNHIFDDLIPFIGDTYGHFRNEISDSLYSASNGLTFGTDLLHHYAVGLIDDDTQSTRAILAILYDPQGVNPYTDYSNISFGTSDKDSGNLLIGSFLVQKTNLSVVPLPAALPLYGAGLAVMGFIGWRKKRKA